MNTSALLIMISSFVVITGFTVYFFLRVLQVQNKQKQNENKPQV